MEFPEPVQFPAFFKSIHAEFPFKLILSETFESSKFSIMPLLSFINLKLPNGVVPRKIVISTKRNTVILF